MKIFLNHALNSLNTAPAPKNIFHMIIKPAYFDTLKCGVLVIKQLTFCSSITYYVRWRVKAISENADAGRGGRVQNQGKFDDVILEHSLRSSKFGVLNIM